MNVILLFCCTFDPHFIKVRYDHCIVFFCTSLTRRDGLIPIMQFLTLFKRGTMTFLTMLDKTISDGGITVDFWIIKVHTSN